VTGAAGFIGSSLVESLSKNNFQIKAVDCFLEDSYDSRLKRKNWQRLNSLLNVDLLEIDLRNPIPEYLLKDVKIIGKSN